MKEGKEKREEVIQKVGSMKEEKEGIEEMKEDIIQEKDVKRK